MFDIGWSELLVIGVVALIVVGPKDLPVMFRTLGRMTGKARGMAREFSRAMDDAARESGVKDLGNDLKAATSKKALGLDALEKAADRFEKWEPKLPGSQTQAKSAAPVPPKPMGPATQALADDRAAAAAARSAAPVEAPVEPPVEPPVALPDPSAPEPRAETPVKRIAKTRSRPAPAETPAETPAEAAPAQPAEAAAPKPKRKRAKTDKGDA